MASTLTINDTAAIVAEAITGRIEPSVQGADPGWRREYSQAQRALIAAAEKGDIDATHEVAWQPCLVAVAGKAAPQPERTVCGASLVGVEVVAQFITAMGLAVPPSVLAKLEPEARKRYGGAQLAGEVAELSERNEQRYEVLLGLVLVVLTEGRSNFRKGNDTVNIDAITQKVLTRVSDENGRARPGHSKTSISDRLREALNAYSRVSGGT